MSEKFFKGFSAENAWFSLAETQGGRRGEGSAEDCCDINRESNIYLALAIKQARDTNSLILDQPCAHISSILQIACVLARFDCFPKSIALKA